MKLTKKMISIILSLVLFFTIIPINVVANTVDKELATNSDNISPEEAVDIYMDNIDMWKKDLFSPDSYGYLVYYGYCLLDVNFDGTLELIYASVNGKANVPGNYIFRINPETKQVEELDADSRFQYHYKPEHKLLKNKTNGKMYYYTETVSLYGGTFYNRGVFYLEDEVMQEENKFFECKAVPGMLGDNRTEVYSYYENGRPVDVTKDELQSRQNAFLNDHIDMNLTWKPIDGDEFDLSDKQTQRQLLLDAYYAYSYDGFSFNEIPNSDLSIAVFTTEKSLSLQVGDSMSLSFGLMDNTYGMIDGRWEKMAITISDPTIISLSEYKKVEYGYAIDVIGNKRGYTNVTITDTETGANTIIVISVYDTYTKSYSYPIEAIKEVYPQNKWEKHIATNIYDLNGLYVNNYQCTQKGDKHYIDFDVYNSKYHIGAVDVYDKDNNWIRSYEIEKFSDISSLVDTGTQFYYMIADPLTGKFATYEQALNAKHSSLSIEVPEGGYFTISNNIKESPGAFLYNYSELLFDAVVEIIDLAGSGKVEASEFGKLLMGEIQKDPTKRELFIELFKDTMEDEFSDFAKNSMKEGVSSAFSDSVTDFEIFIKALNIEWEHLFISAAGIGEGVFEKLSGPAGAALKTCFSFTKASNKYLQVVHLGQSIDEPYATIYSNYDEGTISSNGVFVTTNGNVDAKAVLQVFRISNDDSIDAICDSNNPLEEFVLYNICFVKDEKYVQPNGKVVVKLPIPKGLKSSTCKVYRQESDGLWSVLDASVESNFLTFETDHFSLYSIIGESERLNVYSLPDKLIYTDGDSIDINGLILDLNGEVISEGFVCDPSVLSGSGIHKITVKYGKASVDFNVEVKEGDLGIPELLGDSNGDGKVNVKDATYIQKAVAGMLNLNETEKLAADVDSNGKVNVKDATAIQKWVAGIDTGFAIGEMKQ